MQIIKNLKIKFQVAQLVSLFVERLRIMMQHITSSDHIQRE